MTAFQWAFRIDAEELRKASERVQTSFEDRFQALKWPLSKNERGAGGAGLTKHPKKLELHPVTSEPWKLTAQWRAFQSDLSHTVLMCGLYQLL